MSQSQQADSQASNQQEIQGLVEEIAFQKVLLASIDDSVQNREAAEAEVKAEILSLEKQVRALKRCTTTTASSSQLSTSSQPARTTPSTSSSSKKPANTSPEDDTTLGSAMDSSMNQWHSLSSASSVPSTPHSADSLGDLVSPSRINLPSRKRSHSKHLDGALAPIEDAKSRRTSPSPYMTGPTTPSSIMSSGYGYYPMFGDGYFDLALFVHKFTIISPPSFFPIRYHDEELEAFGDQFFLEQQKQEEDRLRRVRLDEEFARSIQQGLAPQSAISSNTQAGPSSQNAFARMSGMGPPPPAFGNSSASSSSAQLGGSSSRKLPWMPSSSKTSLNPSIKAEPRSMTPDIKRKGLSGMNTGFSSYATQPNLYSRPAIKSEASSSRPMPGSFRDIKSEVSSSRSMPGAFRDDSSDASDSDIEIIPPSAFHDNGRYSRPTGSYGPPQQSMKRSPEAMAAGQAALQQTALFGNDQKHNWMTGAPTNSYNSLGSASSSQNPFMGKSEYVYPGMHATGPGLGYTMNNLPVYSGSNPGSWSNPFSLPEVDASDPYSLDDLILRSGNNLDEIRGHLGLGANMNDQLDYILNDPRKTNEQIKDLLANIRPDDEIPPEDREGTPEGLVYPLYEHQKLALTWLKAMEEGKNKGGILADDMGLGKTISSLALMLSRPSDDRLRKTTLIVGPVALVRQWDREIKKKVKPGFRLSTIMLHGRNRNLGWDDLRTHDVVLTTYGTLAAEWKRLDKFLTERKGQEYDEAPMRRQFPLLGPKSLFYRVLLDEAQCIKNKATLAAKAACQINSLYRFCLTGTPMMNNVGELYSLIHFLRIKPYNEWTRFNEEFGMLTKDSRNRYDLDKIMRKLQAVLKAILLRRTKTSLIDGKPIITLPAKTEEIQHVVFSEEEQDFYKALETKTQLQFNKYLKAGTVGKNYSNVLVLLLRLRQACCHPHLIQDFDEAAPAGGEISVEAMMELAKNLAPEVIARLLAAEDAFECPVCYDGVPNPSIICPCGHDTCSECLTKISDSAVQQNVADGNDGAAKGRCPTCRGDLVLNKVIDYVTFKKVHKPEAVLDDEETASEAEETDASETESEEDDESEDDANSDGDLRNFIVPDDIDDIDDDSTEGEEGDDEADLAPATSKGKAKAKAKSSSKPKKSKKKDKKGKGKSKKEKVHISMAMLKKEATKTKEGRRRYMRYLKKNWQPSAKVTKCVELLGQFREDKKKTIIFSQFVSLLDLVQVPIDENKWKCLRYDGSMSADQRNDAIVKFTDSSECNIMLISLKAGNAGLNLVAASRVIILDPFWNPFIEMQAVDRAYRIGQQDEVQVHRILIEGTVEDRIIALQEKKRRLVDTALNEGAGQAIGRLDVQQLAFLFGVAHDGGR
ncbi:hypothetical protein BDZ45DRAFT_747658 [Acephala macrosclerotiorum]|nr:hypothetical protein BDZ45DRAFT_747658 [Acephala macrosclerotiorum]